METWHNATHVTFWPFSVQFGAGPTLTQTSSTLSPTPFLSLPRHHTDKTLSKPRKGHGGRLGVVLDARMRTNPGSEGATATATASPTAMAPSDRPRPQLSTPRGHGHDFLVGAAMATAPRTPCAPRAALATPSSSLPQHHSPSPLPLQRSKPLATAPHQGVAGRRPPLPTASPTPAARRALSDIHDMR
jgi:hypothetical protein